MFALGYTRTHLLIYARKVHAHIDSALRMTDLDENHRQDLGRLMGHVNGMINALEDNNTSLPMFQLAMFYHFFTLFEYNLARELMPLEVKIEDLNELLRIYNEISVGKIEDGPYVIRNNGRVFKNLISAKLIAKLCKDSVENINKLIGSGDLSEEMLCLLSERIIVIQNIEKMMEDNLYHRFSNIDLHSYYTMTVETTLDIFSVRDSLSAAEFRARNQELQLFLERANKDLTNPADLDPLSSEDFCEWVTYFVKYISSCFKRGDRVEPEPDNGEQAVDVGQIVDPTTSQTYNNDGDIHPLGSDLHFGPGKFFGPDGSAGGLL